jgi:myosin-crossreactive antigen
MRYSNGNYEAFAHPRKPKNVDQKSAYIIVEAVWPDWLPLFS